MFCKARDQNRAKPLDARAKKKNINIPEMIGWDSSGHCFSGGEAARPRAQQRGPEWRGDPLRGGTAVAGSLAVAAAAAGKGLGAWDWG